MNKMKCSDSTKETGCSDSISKMKINESLNSDSIDIMMCLGIKQNSDTVKEAEF